MTGPEEGGAEHPTGRTQAANRRPERKPFHINR